MRLLIPLLLLGLSAGCAGPQQKPTPRPDPTPQEKVFQRPFSVQTKIISELEWKGLARLGLFGTTEYVVKGVRDRLPEEYTVFDDSIIVAVNAPPLAEELLTEIRSIIRAQVTGDPRFSFAEPAGAQAGIASIFSPFRAEQGTTWELLIIVFDRARMADLLRQTPDINPVDAVFRSGVRAMVSHLYPETDLDFAAGTADAQTMDGIRKLYSRALDSFMQPLTREMIKESGG